VDRSHRRGVLHKTNLADSADSARNVNDPLTVRLVCTKIPYQSIYGRYILRVMEYWKEQDCVLLKNTFKNVGTQWKHLHSSGRFMKHVRFPHH
jgi:hypothetical protein